MPRTKRSSKEKKEDRALNGPYLLTRAQRYRRNRGQRDGWEPADLALARERQSRGARLRARNADEAGPAEDPSVAVLVAVAEFDEEQLLEAREALLPQLDRAGPSAETAPLDPDATEAAAANSQAESVGAVPAQEQAPSTIGVDERPAESAAPIAEASACPTDSPPNGADETGGRDEVDPSMIEMNATAAVAAMESYLANNSAEVSSHAEPVEAGANVEDISVSSLINTTSVELDFGRISAPPPDACSSVNESSVDTSTMDSDAESI